MNRKVEWFEIDGDAPESVGTFPLETTSTGTYICPCCGKPAEYYESQIDQDFMGNDVYGWWFDCYECGIGTEAVEGSFNDGEAV